MVTKQFWQGKRVLVTGHTGFKGSWLSLWLQHLGAEVTGCALSPPTSPSLFESADVSMGMTSIEVDVRNFDQLQEAFKAARPELIFHMASQAIVRKSYQNPVETYSTNIMGTVNLFEVIRQSRSVRAVVNITSDKCYENRGAMQRYCEDDRLGGDDPYSSSKGCAELITASYRRSFFREDRETAVASVRAGNVIGGGDWAQDRIIPDAVKASLEKRTLVIRNPSAVRPWQYILDVLRGYLLLAEKLYVEGASFAESWNFGPRQEDAKSVSWLVERFADSWDENVKIEYDKGPHPYEAQYLRLDSSKAGARLGWYSQIDLNEAVCLTSAWYKQYRKNPSLVRDMTLKQITDYMSALQLLSESNIDMCEKTSCTTK